MPILVKNAIRYGRTTDPNYRKAFKQSHYNVVNTYFYNVSNMSKQYEVSCFRMNIYYF